MKLRTYRINQKKYNLVVKSKFMYDLYWAILKKDRYWHYFFDTEGATLRFSPRFESRINRWLTKHSKEYEITFIPRLLYDPQVHEYYGVSFLGDAILPFWNSMSVMMTVYPRKSYFWPLIERLNHGLVNMTGMHDFGQEANIYMDMAFDRARLGGKAFYLPNWVYKIGLNTTIMWYRIKNAIIDSGK